MSHLKSNRLLPVAGFLTAVLAVLAIIIWHFYGVHIRTFNLSMFTGKLTRKQMQEEHALELEAIEKGVVLPPSLPDDYKKRMTWFIPVSVIISAVLLAGLVWFVTFEKTAIETIPPYEIEIVPAELSE